MTTSKTFLTPINKEPKICHALATTSEFNLKLCRMSFCDSVYVWASELPWMFGFSFFEKVV